MEYKLGVVGSPIEHSLSPEIHNIFAKELNIKISYEKYLVNAGELSSFCNQFFDNPNALGLNVTLPLKKEALELSKSLLNTIAKLGILKGGLSVINTALSTNFTTILISKSIQSFTSCWLIRIVGLSIKEYFINGQTWGDKGIQEVIEDIYKLNKREEILNKFIREAIKKIRIKESDQFQQKLPPYFQKD